MTHSTRVFWNGRQAVDFVHEPTGNGLYSHLSPAALAEQHGPLEVITSLEAAQREETAAITSPEPTTAEDWMRMLEVLPPKHWRTVAGAESFQLIEHYTGRVTLTLMRIGTRYWRWYDIAGLPMAELVAKVRQVDGATS